MKINRSPALPCFSNGLTLLALALCFCATATAQLPYEKHSLIRGDMPPGLAAESYRLANPELIYVTQPVRLIVPDTARIQIGSQGVYTDAFSARVTVGMTVGPVYRFKVTDIPRHYGVELYPSIELLNKLNPPKGLENEFPIQINISQDDLEQAIEGRMVTKVIYLENPDTAMPHRHVENHQPYFDVAGNADPLRAAERLGRPMAILRLGSRIPTNDAEDQGFGFYSPSPVLLSDSHGLIENSHDSGWAQQTDGMREPARHLPPIVPGSVQPVDPIRFNDE